MKRSPTFWNRHFQTSRLIFATFASLLIIVWGTKAITQGDFTPPGFLSVITILSLIELLFAHQAKNNNPPK